MCWLINSMTNDVRKNFIVYEMTQQIWNVTRETYLNTKDTAAAYEVEGILHDFIVGIISVA